MDFAIPLGAVLIGTGLIASMIKAFTDLQAGFLILLLVFGTLISFFLYAEQRKKSIDAISIGFFMFFVSMGNCDDIVEIGKENSANLADCYKYFPLDENMINELNTYGYSLLEYTDLHIVLEKEGTKCKIGVITEDNIRYLRFDMAEKL